MTLFAVLCCVVLAACAQSAMARSASRAAVPVQSDFDLARHDSGGDEGARYRVSGDLDGRRYPKDQLGPYVTYNPVSGGPTLEFGALGAGRKGTPGLAHVGMDWTF